ncbi:phosphatase PAP2 family protein [Weissella cibaria]|uniref:phosphatase PAP2 family protein n=1 Tax=Weissella cibaria TaxID=137591 RepID=UPI00119056EB|nr:phosphatase PAP2 family protein [Weissella cibaria]TVV30267.1 phosphatase PAP2 family protein [Weissella cibaria]
MVILNKRLTMPISGLAILLFAFFAWGVMQHATWISDIDRTGIAWIRGDFTPGKTAFLTGITLLAQPATGVTLTALFVVWAVITKHLRMGAFVGFSVVVGAGLMWIIKNIVQRPRPTANRLITEHGYSFPSGHSINAMAFYGALLVLIWLYARKQWVKGVATIVLVAVIILIPISRVYLGVHYPSDVLAGLLLGLATMLTAATIILPKKA